mmetsp:Transcript_2557/g.3958  ORF Transcript_2557/g.3958 Transcript_2557/m.3958 type:complete len:103 (-) Transcript_2557:8-316(-)
MIMNEMGSSHGQNDAVHQSSIHATPDVNHNLAWQQPHVESGVDCLRLTSCDAVAASRQCCACLCDITMDLLMSCRKHISRIYLYPSQTFHFQNPCFETKEIL